MAENPLQQFFSKPLPNLGTPRTSSSVRGFGSLGGGEAGTSPNVEELIRVIVGGLLSRGDDDGGPQDEEPVGGISGTNPEDLSTKDLIEELSQGLKPDSIGENIMKGLGGALTVPGFVNFVEGKRLEQDLGELQDRGELDPGLTIEDLRGINLQAAIDVSRAFESGDGDTSGARTTLGGSAGDFEGVSFSSDDNGDGDGFGRTLGGSAGDFEGVSFDDDDDDDDDGFGGGADPDDGFGPSFHRGTSFIHGPDPKRKGEDVSNITLQEGEAVLNRELVQLLGPEMINTLNQMAQGRVKRSNQRRV